MSNDTDKQKSNSLIELKDLTFLLRLLRKNILIIITVPLVFYAIGYIYSYRMTDVYGAKTQLLLKSQETYDYQDPIYQGLGGSFGAYMDVRNQIRILQSRDLVAEVVDKMDANTSYFVMGRLKKKEVFGTLPFKTSVDIFNPDLVYENPIDIVVSDKETYTGTFIKNGAETSFKGKFGERIALDDFAITLKRNYLFDDENIAGITSSNYQVVFHSDAFMINHFLSKMEIENLEYTSILELRLTDEIGTRAKVFLDTLAGVFIDYSQRSQLEINKNTLVNIEKQIDEVQKILVNIENELLKYKKDNDIIELTKEEDAYFTQYVVFTEQERDLSYKLSSVRLLANYIQTSEDERLLPPAFYILDGDAYLQEKVNDFYSKQLTLTDMSYSVSETHPTIDKMKSEMVEMRKDLLTYLTNLSIALETQIEDNARLIAKYKSNVQGIPISLQGIDNIKRELDVNNRMYLFLLEKKTNTLIAKAGIIPQVQIVEKSVSLGIIGPEKDKIKRLFVLAGILGGLFIAFVRKIFFEKIENVQELKDITALNVVAGIPFVKAVNTPLVVNDSPKAHVTESFRTLRSNISFMGAKQSSGNATVILISSFFPGEGKTFCSANLATILAKSEKKVLLIDFDMHKPKVHKTFDIPNTCGVSNYLVGQATKDEVINKDYYPNLDVITCGPVPPNPSELVLKQEISNFLKSVSTEYDYIIIDTPPFGLLNDSIELSVHADVFLGVMNTKFAKKRGVRAIEEILTKREDISLGLILNGIQKSKIRYYYSKYSYKYSYRYSYSQGYGYGYGSGYGQGYGDDSKEK